MVRTQIRLNDEQRHLVEQHVPLVGFVLHRYGNHGLGCSPDTFQISTLGLMRAAANYDSSRARFSTFAVRSIRGELCNEQRRSRRAKRGGGAIPYPLDAPAYESGSAYLDRIADPTASVEDAVIGIETLALIHSAIQRYCPDDAQLLEDYLFNGLLQREIAAKYGLSQSCVSRHIREGTHRLRKYLRGVGYER